MQQREQLLERFSSEHSDLIMLGQRIGAEALNEVLAVLGRGERVYIPGVDTFWSELQREARNAEIAAKFKGNNFKELQQEYGLSERQLRRIVNS